jgi:hypothetical protein
MKKLPTKAELDKLIELAEYDLKIRSELVKNNELTKFGYHPKMKKVHEDNLLYLEEFLSFYGWPEPSKYGKEAFEASWFISIHAIEKKKQMKEALIAVKVLLDEGEDIAYQYASLYDHITRFETGKQRFGTQLSPSKSGWQATDLEDKEQVDKYRAEIGLPSLAEKIQEFNSSDEPGVIENEDAEQRKYEEWLNNSEWRKN